MMIRGGLGARTLALGRAERRARSGLCVPGSVGPDALLSTMPAGEASGASRKTRGALEASGAFVMVTLKPGIPAPAASGGPGSCDVPVAVACRRWRTMTCGAEPAGGWDKVACGTAPRDAGGVSTPAFHVA
jgi:hypothetical protein